MSHQDTSPRRQSNDIPALLRDAIRTPLSPPKHPRSLLDVEPIHPPEPAHIDSTPTQAATSTNTMRSAGIGNKLRTGSSNLSASSTVVHGIRANMRANASSIKVDKHIYATGTSDRSSRGVHSESGEPIGAFDKLHLSATLLEEPNAAKSDRPDSSIRTRRNEAETSIRNASRPKFRHRASSVSTLDTPPRHLQRTISSLLDIPSARPTIPTYVSRISSSLPRTNSFFNSQSSLLVPKLPTIPSLTNVTNMVPSVARNFSVSTRDDQSVWKTWWEGSGVLLDGAQGDEKAKKHAHKHMLDDSDRADTVEEEEEHIKQKYQCPKNPIVFCHGLLGFDYIGPKGLPSLQISHWRGICEVLQANGAELMIAKVPATSSAKERAEILMQAIEETFPGREVNLVAHSMGGLDGRYLISRLRPETFKVVSLTTIACPHRGSPFADYLIDNVIGRERLPSWLAVLDKLSLHTAGDGSAFNALTTESMAIFNEQVPDDPNVKYYSWGASYEPGWFDPLRWGHDTIKAAEGENDGLVSVASSKWGEFRGTLVGCSHVDLVGWVNHVRFTMEAWAGRPIAFKPATFYLEVADHLAKQGF